MSKVIVGTVCVAVAMLVLALLMPQAPVSVPLGIGAFLILAGAAMAIFASAWTTKGWTLRHPGGGSGSSHDA